LYFAERRSPIVDADPYSKTIHNFTGSGRKKHESPQRMS